MSQGNMNLTLKVWKQKNKNEKGRFETFDAKGISPDMSFLEMFDVVNEHLISSGKEPIAFDHDCREGICGMCSMYINGRPHGPKQGVTTCQLHMRSFKDGDTIVFCLGEIDCRCHIHKHITETTTYQDIINNIVDNYFEAIELNLFISQITPLKI